MLLFLYIISPVIPKIISSVFSVEYSISSEYILNASARSLVTSAIAATVRAEKMAKPTMLAASLSLSAGDKWLCKNLLEKDTVRGYRTAYLLRRAVVRASVEHEHFTVVDDSRRSFYAFALPFKLRSNDGTFVSLSPCTL